jgi:chloramphenicol O-acetyltransferase
VVNVPFIDEISEYCKLAYKTANEQRKYFKGPLGNDVFQCSPMPWVTFSIFRIQIRERKIMQLHYLIGENSMRKMEEL